MVVADYREDDHVMDYTPLDGGDEGFVRCDWVAAFQAAGLAVIPDFLRVEGEALSKPGLGSRYRARLQVTRGTQIQTVYLKRYGQESISAKLKRWCESGKWSTVAEQEASNAIALGGQGLTVPEPLAWGRDGASSFVVWSAVNGDAVDRWLDRHPFPATNDGWRRKCRLAVALAAQARQFHQAGWRHRDFYLCHHFAAESPAGFATALIDLARVFRPRWRTRRWLVKDLAQLNYSASARHFSRAMRMRFFKHYLGCVRLDRTHQALARRILRKTRSIRCRGR